MTISKLLYTKIVTLTRLLDFLYFYDTFTLHLSICF